MQPGVDWGVRARARWLHCPVQQFYTPFHLLVSVLDAVGPLFFLGPFKMATKRGVPRLGCQPRACDLING